MAEASKAEAEAKEKERLRYIGQGAFWPGVPARDLSATEVEQYGGLKKLLSSGLYEPVKDGK